MDLSQFVDFHHVTSGVLIGSGAFVVNWARKVNASINETVKSAALLHERLNGHEKLDDARHEAVETRLDDLGRHW